jgi:2-C-methyl-D-erythritol 4-phosphate cytidylyltransferase
MDGRTDKLLLRLHDRPVVAWSVLALDGCPQVDSITVVASEHNLEELAAALNVLPTRLPLDLILGGPRRQDSVGRAVDHLAAGVAPELVVIHDGARPLLSAELLGRVIDAAIEHGAATAGLPLKNACKEVDETGLVRRSVERASMMSIQTPQAFSFAALLRAHEEGRRQGAVVDDDAELVERLGLPVKVVPGEYRNIKITTAEDIPVLEAHVQAMATGAPGVG